MIHFVEENGREPRENHQKSSLLTELSATTYQLVGNLVMPYCAIIDEIISVIHSGNSRWILSLDIKRSETPSSPKTLN